MGGKLVAQGTDILNQAGIPTFSYPDTAARAFSYMWRYTYNLRGIYETPSLAEEVRTRTADPPKPPRAHRGKVCAQRGRTDAHRSSNPSKF